MKTRLGKGRCVLGETTLVKGELLSADWTVVVESLDVARKVVGLLLTGVV